MEELKKVTQNQISSMVIEQQKGVDDGIQSMS